MAERPILDMVMTCINPIYLNARNIFVRCGKCEACRKSRAREWSLRLVHEVRYHEKSAFVTLTYNKESLPVGLDKRELQLFWKRLRRAVEPRRLSYFACGEYGSTYGRPHYHAIIFGFGSCGECRVCSVYKNRAPVEGSDCYFLERSWPHGFVDASGVGIESARYVANYIAKSGRVPDGAIKPFAVMSQGLGKRFAMDNKEKLYADQSVRVGKGKVGIPRYYKKLFAGEYDYQMAKVVEFYFSMIGLRKVWEVQDKRTDRFDRRGPRSMHGVFYSDEMDQIKANIVRSRENATNVRLQYQGPVS